MTTPTHVPTSASRPFLTEGGLETDLIFNHGVDLPEFAAFPLVTTMAGRASLTAYFADYVAIARAQGTGAVFETPTWRASSDWGTRLGYDADQLDQINRSAVQLLHQVAATSHDIPVVVSGNVGPRVDGYAVGGAMSRAEATAYHRPQITSLVAGGADQIGALTMTYTDEAAGIVEAATEVGAPVAISFTVETDGRLPSGASLATAIERVDQLTDGAAAYFGINCAHPTHMARALEQTGPWERLGLLRYNASRASHEELDEAVELDRGDPQDLLSCHRALVAELPSLVAVGGCCGTDIEHVGLLHGGPVMVGSA
ncbi:homocysteine S-methyltransferase family protein [Euzebya tangerina]|uniref:homocysteine S-methyltransferase family protein n=1 Tax=Euzebya tangerina TaxID=591198 RepID=UPI000E313892|nr:homocysteine S-methyltransferase family protein [Euzebya tangerina]